MDDVIIAGVVAAASLVGGFFLGRRQTIEPPHVEQGPVESVTGALMKPQGGHKHVWTTQFNDGAGWRCGFVVEPGVICGWAKEGEPSAG